MRSEFFYAIEEARSRHYIELYLKIIENKKLTSESDNSKTPENQKKEPTPIQQSKIHQKKSSMMERAMQSVISFFESDIIDDTENHKESEKIVESIDWQQLSKIRRQKINELSKQRVIQS